MYCDGSDLCGLWWDRMRQWIRHRIFRNLAVYRGRIAVAGGVDPYWVVDARATGRPLAAAGGGLYRIGSICMRRGSGG